MYQRSIPLILRLRLARRFLASALRWVSPCSASRLEAPQLGASQLASILLVIASLAYVVPAAAGTAPSQYSMSIKMLFRGIVGGSILLKDGDHLFHVRVFRQDGALLHEEELTSEVRQGRYDLILGLGSRISTPITAEDVIEVAVAGQHFRTRLRDATYSLLTESLLNTEMDASEHRTITAFDLAEISAQLAERRAISRGLLEGPLTLRNIPEYLQVLASGRDLSMEMSLASPSEIKPGTDLYQLAKYGRLNLEMSNFLRLDGDVLGFAARALHVAHHLLLYAAGLTTDVNNDGMFLLTLGAAHYQTGNKRNEPFVDAPFIRLRYHSTPKEVFAYTELETTMHYRSYISGTAGLGIRLGPRVQIIGGLHHTEFVQPTERQVQIVEGFHGIIRWGL